MHKYLRAIGFSQIKNKKQLNELIDSVILEADEKLYTSDKDDTLFAEYNKYISYNVGISIRGEYDENDKFIYDYYFPFCKSEEISSFEDVSIERHAEKESYAGICDDIKIGVSLIFYLQNIISYIKFKNAGKLPVGGTSLVLSGLSISGSIMMPIKKNETDKKKTKQALANRNHLIAAARKGDEDAIESLTLEDMDTYTSISRKILKEDIFTLVDTYFMPYGVECDHYSVLGEILEMESIKNAMTNEELYRLSVNCNEMIFDICINKQDLLGEPKVGRRFKGVIWLQGYINFPE